MQPRIQREAFIGLFCFKYEYSSHSWKKTDGKIASTLISPARAAFWAMQQPCQVNSNWNWKKKKRKEKKEERRISCFDCFLWSVTVTLCFAVTLRTRRKTWQCAALLFLFSAFWSTLLSEMDGIEVRKRTIFMQIHSVVLFSVFFDYPLRTQAKKDKKKKIFTREDSTKTGTSMVICLMKTFLKIFLFPLIFWSARYLWLVYQQEPRPKEKT